MSSRRGCEAIESILTDHEWVDFRRDIDQRMVRAFEAFLLPDSALAQQVERLPVKEIVPRSNRGGGAKS